MLPLVYTSDTQITQVTDSLGIFPAKVYEKKKSRKVATPTWETRSAYPLRENIWEYLYEDKTKFYKRKDGRACCKQTPAKNKRRGKIVICLPLLFSAFGAISKYSKMKYVPCYK